MIDEQNSEFLDDESGSEASPKLSRRALLTGLFALPIAALDASSAEAQYIGFGPFRLHLGPTGGGYNGGGGYSHRTRRPPRQAVHHHSGGGGSRHASRRSRGGGGGHDGGGGGGDTGGGANSSATGLGKADY
ncbi:hypothetical+protein [Methylocapsa aurea]|jgi:hypothetical protein|uniref:hypothetical protein n=1 Tax=Methylocapsa aurea TaxID=663610 RepID=UPI003D18C99B